MKSSHVASVKATYLFATAALRLSMMLYASSSLSSSTRLKSYRVFGPQ